jgi:predicted nuclease of predicted toxin-antitoxin system
MRLLLDEDSQWKRLVRLLRDVGHDVQTVTEAGLIARPDAEVLAFARQESRVLLTLQRRGL